MSEEVLLRYVGGEYIRETDYQPPRASRYGRDHSWTTTKELPTGRFRIVAYSPYPRVEWSLTWNETAKVSLSSILKTIIKAVTAAVPELMTKLEAAEQQAERENQQWLAQQEKWRREEDRRRVDQSIKESKEQLASVIERWSKVMDVEGFLTGVERRAEMLPDEERAAVAERLRLARKFLGSQDPLDFFPDWRAPQERYRPIYPIEGEATDE